MADQKRQIKRIIDANSNRAKEGLRVCEDVCRFVLNKRTLTTQYKELRHDLSLVLIALGFKEFVDARDIVKDVGKKTSSTEKKRANFSDIFFANSQRVKESIRVLEETAKLINTKQAQQLKNLRYRCYELERKASLQL